MSRPWIHSGFKIRLSATFVILWLILNHCLDRPSFPVLRCHGSSGGCWSLPRLLVRRHQLDCYPCQVLVLSSNPCHCVAYALLFCTGVTIQPKDLALARCLHREHSWITHYRSWGVKYAYGFILYIQLLFVCTVYMLLYVVSFLRLTVQYTQPTGLYIYALAPCWHS